MNQLPLAEFDMREWFNLAVILLIFGGSAIGGFLKWLVAQFGNEEQKPEKPQQRAPRTETDVRPRASTPRPPTARPMPQRPPAARPLPSQPVARAPEQGRPPMPVPSLRKPARAQPIRRQRPVPGSTGSTRRVLPPDQPLTPRSSPRRVQSPKRISSPASLASRTASIPAPTSSTGGQGAQLGHLDPDGNLGHIQKEGHLGHLSQKARKAYDTELPNRTDGEDILGEMSSLRHPTRCALRRAVIMNEILGPPLGLRSIDQMGYLSP